jgi:hypothetical protein
MMGTKKAAFHAGFLLSVCALGGPAHAHPVPKEPLARVRLIDAKLPSAAVVVGELPMGEKKLRFYRLSAPLSRGVECCVTMGEGGASTTALRYLGSDASAATAFAATFTQPLDDGFVGLALVGHDVRVRRVNAHKVSVSWKHRQGKVDVVHCLSREGLHVRLSHASQRVHYYLPLDMAVEPNCPASMGR